MPVSTINGASAGSSGTILTTTSPKAGNVIQVVSGTTTTTTSNSTATYADTTLSATITPSSTSSRILVLISHPNTTKSAGDAGNALQFRLVRNGSQVREITAEFMYSATALYFNSTFSFNYVDSPSSTSALTYKTQFRNGQNTAQVQVQGDSFMSTITLLEIAG
jgi:hypothetical protein